VIVKPRQKHIRALVFAAVLVCQARAARADSAAAETLYREGRALMEQGQYALACEKLKESQRIEPGSGTQLNLADCYAKLGKTATAWAEFLEVERLARKQERPERAEEAKRRAAELESKLSYLTLTVTAAVPGLEVYRDDDKLEAGALGSKIPVDPGRHVLRATAPGHREWSATVTVGPAGDSKKVELPTLEPISEKPEKPTRPIAKPSSRPSGASAPDHRGAGLESSNTTAYVIGGVGVAATTVGAVFGVMALSSYSDVKDACPSLKGCSQDTVDQRNKAELQANIANVGIGVGLVGIAVSTVMLMNGRSAERPPAARTGLWLAPVVYPSGAAAGVGARF